MEACESFDGAVITDSCRSATREEIELIHKPSYYDYIAGLAGQQAMLDPDTEISSGSFEASLKAAGGVIQAVEFAAEGKDNRAFCAVRPPGHHAEADRAKGFCIFNNIAIGAARALNNSLAAKIAIVDWDVHHGNGTQNAFYDSPRVLYISLHQFPLYPGTGSALESGRGEGEGFTLNLPMKYGAGDDDYRLAFDNAVLPAIDNYKPDLLLISAGFDGHRDDPLASLNLSSAMYGEMTRKLVEMANKHCRCGVVSVFEGGYNLRALKESVIEHLKGLSDGK